MFLFNCFSKLTASEITFEQQLKIKGYLLCCFVNNNFHANVAQMELNIFPILLCKWRAWDQAGSFPPPGKSSLTLLIKVMLKWTHLVIHVPDLVGSYGAIEQFDYDNALGTVIGPTSHNRRNLLANHLQGLFLLIPASLSKTSKY